jgi:protein TonB
MPSPAGSLRAEAMAERLARRRRDPATDRLATAVFVAALVHGVVIMGVKFSAPALDDRPLPTLEILLVPPGPDDPEANEGAAYLAQRNQQGSGTSEEAKRSSLPEAQPQQAPDALDLPVDPELERSPPAADPCSRGARSRPSDSRPVPSCPRPRLCSSHDRRRRRPPWA